MASKKDSKGSAYMKVGKGQTKLLIPEPLPSDSTDNTVVTLFNEENELGPTADCGTMSELQINPQPPSSYKKTPKRKLEIEFGSLSQTTPRRVSGNFKELQNFWENESGGKSTTQSLFNSSDKSDNRTSCEMYESPIDTTLKNFDSSAKVINTPIKSAKQIASNYTQLIQSVVKPNVIQPQSYSREDDKHNVYDFKETDYSAERMSLKEFRQTKCESPMKEVVVVDKKSPLMFDTNKFHVKKSKNLLNRSGNACNSVNTANVSVESQFANDLGEGEKMPPPSTIPKCLSVKKHKTPSPRNFRKVSLTTPKPRQKLFVDAEFSSNDLVPPSPEIGQKRKCTSKKRLLSMDPSNYSELFSPPSHEDVSDGDQKFENPASLSVTIKMNGEIRMEVESSDDTDSDLWTESESEINLSEISAATPTFDRRYCKINESSVLASIEKTTETKKIDSFFDLSLNNHVEDSECSMVNIDNISAIESGTVEVMEESQSSLDYSELSTPEIVKVSGSRKRLILEKAQTSFNDTLISVGDKSADNSSLDSEVANVINEVVGNYLVADESATNTSMSKNKESNASEDPGLENCEDNRLNETFPEPCTHVVSVAELRAVVTDLTDANGNIANSDQSDDFPTISTNEISRDTDDETVDSMSTEYDYNSILSSPPLLHIDLSRLGELSPQSKNAAVKVTENVEYESAGDILDLDKQQNESDLYLVPETLKTLCVRTLVDRRSSVYSELLPGKVLCENSYLSVPLHVDVGNSPDQTISSHTFTFDLANDKELNMKQISQIVEPCYSPSLTCLESPTRNLCWSPSFSEAEIGSEYSDSYIDLDIEDGSSDSNTVNKYPKVVTKRNLKRPRCLIFDSYNDSDIDTPSPKIPRTPLTAEHFEYPDVKETDKKAVSNGAKLTSSEKSDNYEYDSESEMKTLSEIDDRNLLEQSYLSDNDYPESLNSSTAYSNSFKFWSPASSLSIVLQWSPTNSLSEHESDKVSFGSSELETYPVYTQSGPTYMPPQTIVTSSPEFFEPLDLSMSGKKDCELETENNEIVTFASKSTVQNEILESNLISDLYEPICISEPCVAILEQNNSTVWKEIKMGNKSYSYEPSIESTQYATDCFNNAVYGASLNKDMSMFEPRYIATALYPNPAVTFPKSEQSDKVDLDCSVPAIEGVTVPIQNLPDGVVSNVTVPAVLGVTVPLQNNHPLMNHEQMCPNACLYGDNSSSKTEHSQDGYESTGNLAGSSDSDSENDLMKLMDDSVREKLKKKAGSKYIPPSDGSFDLSDSLKDVRPYVISGWISSTYLMALSKKPDLVNDMFDNALNEKGEIHDWIVESCRKTTPAVLARDLIFRLFMLKELQNLNLISLARKRRFKAMKKCVEKQFPQKLTRCVWNKCLGLIKSSVSTLFKHRVRHVQNFLVMHGACV